MRDLRYKTAALTDLTDIAAYIANESGSRSIAETFVGRLRRKCLDLAALPGTMGRARPELGPDIRSTVFRNYAIFFRYIDATLEILAVLERHRDVEQAFGEE